MTLQMNFRKNKNIFTKKIVQMVFRPSYKVFYKINILYGNKT